MARRPFSDKWNLYIYLVTKKKEQKVSTSFYFQCLGLSNQFDYDRGHHLEFHEGAEDNICKCGRGRWDEYSYLFKFMSGYEFSILTP